jgi:Tetratricopeptide repeat
MDTPEGGYVAGGGAEAARTEEAPAATDRLVDATRAGRAEARREANELGEAESPALGQDTLQRCRRVLGPDHPATLLAAAALPLALVQLGDAEEARALAEDTLQRCQRVYGPDHPTTLYLTQTANTGRLEFDEDDAASGRSP